MIRPSMWVTISRLNLHHQKLVAQDTGLHCVTTDGDWVKVVKGEKEQSAVTPKPPPPNAFGTGRWNSDGEW
eukprot:6091318-Amphidinium_carterae.1